jgi:hypothetical protein
MMVFHTLKIYKRIPANKMMKEIKEKLAELYAYRARRATTYLIFEIRQLIEKDWEYERVSDGIHSI